MLVEKTGLCGREDSALSAVRPPVNTTFLKMALVLKRLPTPILNQSKEIDWMSRLFVSHV